MTPVRVVRANGTAVDTRSEDVSEGGMLVVAQTSLAPGERVRLRFASPLDGQLHDADADVRWIKPSYGRVAVGLEFVAPSDSLRAALKQFIELMLPRIN